MTITIPIRKTAMRISWFIPNSFSPLLDWLAVPYHSIHKKSIKYHFLN